MNPSEISTYENFRVCYTSRDITKADIVNICSSLNREFMLNKLGNHEFEPEPITEGGIIFKSYSGHGPYKSIRFLMNRNWKTVYPDKPWTLNDTEVVLVKNNRIDLFLKAFHGAPKWSNEEKLIFKRVFCNNGFTTNKRGLKIVDMWQD